MRSYNYFVSDPMLHSGNAIAESPSSKFRVKIVDCLETEIQIKIPNTNAGRVSVPLKTSACSRRPISNLMESERDDVGC